MIEFRTSYMFIMFCQINRAPGLPQPIQIISFNVMMEHFAMALLIQLDGDVVKTRADEPNVLLTTRQCVLYIVHGEIIAVMMRIIASNIKGVSDFVMIHVRVDAILYVLELFSIISFNTLIPFKRYFYAFQYIHAPGLHRLVKTMCYNAMEELTAT